MNRSKWLLGVMALLGAAAVSAEVYHYTDSNGRKIYVDRKSQIPAQYREQTKVRQEESQTLNRAERERRQQTLDRIETMKGSRAEVARIEAEMASLEQAAEVKGNSVKVPVKIRYLGKTVTARLIVDTGASRTILHKNIGRRLGANATPRGQARVVGGAVIPLGVISAKEVNFGPVSKRDMELAVIDTSEAMDYDGLLGMDILSTLKYELDMERKLVVWNADRYRALAREREELLAQAN